MNLVKIFQRSNTKNWYSLEPLYNDPEILILDESTNNLDKETEENFIKSIKKISESKTVIIISHDTRPLEICDEIYEINEISKASRWFTN